MYFDSLDGSSETIYREIPSDSAAYFTQAPPSGQYTICDRTLTGSFNNLVDLPGTAVTYGVRSVGTWTMDLWASAFMSSQAKYNWPVGPVADGYWPAYNLNTQNRTYVKIEQALAQCDILQGPNGRLWLGTKFIRFYGVRARDNQMRVRPGSDDGNVPGGGTPPGCTWDWVILEIDYGDGTGWHELWEGWARICDN